MHLIYRKSNISTALVLAIAFISSCSSGSSSNVEVADSLKGDSSKVDTLLFNEEINNNEKNEVESESLNLEMNDFEQSILNALEEGLYLVQTKQGFDYIKTDFNQDGFDDAIALITFDLNSDSYDFETKVMIMLFQTYDDEILLQTGGRSENLGGESIQHNELKKLTWSNGTITYRHQSVENTMEVDIKMKYLQNGGPKALIEKVSLCHYDTGSECKELFVASEQDTVELIKLDKEFLSTLIEQ